MANPIVKAKRVRRMPRPAVFALGAAFGVIAGTVAGILTAPKSGAETRKDLEKKGREALKKAEEYRKKLEKSVVVTPTDEKSLPEEKVIAEVKLCPKKAEAAESTAADEEE